ncbi:MAG TPA: TolC family protein [Polyangiaceae bacterium]|nr:TolC family protein [Polyangiaceae bacterium]
MNILPFSSLILAVSLALPAVAGAEPISRSTLIRRALHENPQVAAANARHTQAEAEQVQADAARWPQLNLQLGVGPALRAELVPGTGADSTRSRYSLTADDISVAFGGQLSVIQPLYTFGKIDGFRAAAAHGVQARDQQTQMTRAEVALEVARLYEGLLFARDATRFFEELENYLDRTILATEGRLKADATEVSEQDVLRLRSALSAVRLSLHYARAARSQAQAGIVAQLTLPTGTELDAQEDQLRALPMSPKAVAPFIAQALRRRPELAALRQGALAYDALASAESAGMLPDVFVMAFADAAYTPGRDLVKSRYIVDPLYHFDPGVLLGLRWQVQGRMASGRADQRRAQARELRELQTFAVSGLPAQVQKSYADVQRSDLDIVEARDAVTRAKRWMVQASSDYSAGLADSRSVVDAVRAYAELRTAELEATYRHNVALAELAHATGTLVDDQLGLYPGRLVP